MSYARPLVVSSDSAGYKEVLPEGAYFSVEPTPSLIAEKINFLVEHPKKAQQMGEIAWNASKKFTWENTAKELSALFYQTHDEYLHYSVIKKQDGRDDRPPFVGVHYFAWYDAKTMEHWGDNPRHGSMCDTPQSGLYSSTNRNVITRHLESMDAVVGAAMMDRSTPTMTLFRMT